MAATSDVSHAQLLEQLQRSVAQIINDDPEPADVQNSTRPPSVAGSALARPHGPAQDKFFPKAPASLREAGLPESTVEALTLRYMLQVRKASGAELSRQLALPFVVLEKVLASLKEQRLLAHKGTSTLHDYVYELTELGVGTAQSCARECTYFGAAPVSLEDYVAAVAAQSLSRLRANPADVGKAFGDLNLTPEMLEKIGRAVRSGKGLFLYGAPGNGKTCIAERITKAYGLSIWIPRALNAFGEIIRLYDPSLHKILPLEEGGSLVDSEQIDHRWVRIQRPTIIVGGELTMDSLEIRIDRQSGIGEAPLQLKSNCGTLVIDDFGRQRIAPAELLNRWIIPLEKRYDFLTVGSGRKIQVPFDQFVIFSTNLAPTDLVDEAFLRRIPYKIDVPNPSETQFRELFLSLAAKLKVACSAEQLEYLLESCYRSTGRSFRFCHARDLLHQIEVYSDYRGEPLQVSRAAVEAAASNYFSMV